MKQLFSFFSIFLKRYCRNIGFIPSIILIPLICAIIAAGTSSENVKTNLKIGMMIEKETESTKHLEQLISKLEFLELVEYEEREQLEEDVKIGKITVGYIIDKEFDAKVEKADLSNAIEVVKLSNDPYHKYLNEIIFSAAYSIIIPEITYRFLDNREVSVEIEEIREYIDEYLEGEELFSINYATPEEYTENTYMDKLDVEAPLSSSLPIMRGGIALVLMFLALIGSISMRKCYKGFSLYFPYIGRFRTELYALFPLYFIAFLSSVLGIILYDLGSSESFSLVSEILRLIPYLLFVIIFSLILPRLLNAEAIILLIPFILVFILVTHPILFNIEAIVPQVKVFVQYLPTYIYID